MEGPDQTATKWSNAEADKANGYLNGWGLLARSPDFLCVISVCLAVRLCVGGGGGGGGEEEEYIVKRERGKERLNHTLQIRTLHGLL